MCIIHLNPHLMLVLAAKQLYAKVPFKALFHNVFLLFHLWGPAEIQALQIPRLSTLSLLSSFPPGLVVQLCLVFFSKSTSLPQTQSSSMSRALLPLCRFLLYL